MKSQFNINRILSTTLRLNRENDKIIVNCFEGRIILSDTISWENQFNTDIEKKYQNQSIINYNYWLYNNDISNDKIVSKSNILSINLSANTNFKGSFTKQSIDSLGTPINNKYVYFEKISTLIIVLTSPM